MDLQLREISFEDLFDLDTVEVEATESRKVNLGKDDASLSQPVVALDEDGDLILTRRNKLFDHDGGVTIQHNIMSSIASVGLQIWRAELVLADFVLHKIFTSADFDGIIAVELGAGTGLVGILVSYAANAVYITDYGDEILDNCAKNVDMNSRIRKSHSSVRVRELDWKKPWPPLLDSNSTSHGRHSWTLSEVEEVNWASVLLAADVIYSDDLTDAFFTVAEKLMSQGQEKVLYLALEKRYNFSLCDLDVVANGYSHFRSFLRDNESKAFKSGSLPSFVGKRVDISVLPQYVREYERGNDVELWEIEYVKRKPETCCS